MRIVESLRKSLLLGTQSEDLFCNPPHYLSFLQTMILSHFQSNNHTLLFNYNKLYTAKRATMPFIIIIKGDYSNESSALHDGIQLNYLIE